MFIASKWNCWCELSNVRKKLITNITSQIPEHHKQFLRSFYNRNPEWDLLGIAGVQHLPAVRWREMNLDRSGEGTKESLLEKLEQVIGS